MLDRIRSLLSYAVAMLLVGVITLTITVGTVIMVPFLMISQRLFNWPNKAPDQKNVDEYYSVFEAMAEGNLDFLNEYAKANPEFPDGVNKFIGRHWLTNAIDSGSVKSVEWVLSKGVEVNYFDDEGRSALMSAIEDESRKTTDVLELLLAAGADVRAMGTLDVTALHHAAYRGSLDAVKLLLEHGADPKAYDCDYTPETPIDCAKRAKRPEIVALMESYSK
jgi:hypothetical protein